MLQIFLQWSIFPHLVLVGLDVSMPGHSHGNHLSKSLCMQSFELSQMVKMLRTPPTILVVPNSERFQQLPLTWVLIIGFITNFLILIRINACCLCGAAGLRISQHNLMKLCLL